MSKVSSREADKLAACFHLDTVDIEASGLAYLAAGLRHRAEMAADHKAVVAEGQRGDCPAMKDVRKAEKADFFVEVVRKAERQEWWDCCHTGR